MWGYHDLPALSPGFEVALLALCWRFGVALVEPWWSLGVALVWLWCGFRVALRWLCTPESMPSICLLYGFVVALGGFDGQFQLKPKRESARLAKTLHALASLS